MAQLRKSFGINRRLLSVEYFQSLEYEHALAILDSHEMEITPWLERDETDQYRRNLSAHSRRLLRDKLRRIERIRAALNNKAPSDGEPA
jgi:hypothetical protein